MRSAYLDNLRGTAVVWMIIFHTAYDLKTFGLLELDFSQGFWFGFPRVIAFTFLFCVGASLNHAHGERVNWDSLKQRTVKLGLSAGLVSAGTYLLFPTQWIFFGTLHCILVGSILGALLVNNRRTAGVVLGILLVFQYALGFDIKWVSSVLQRPSMDFIPIYPWFWVIVAGLLADPYLSRIGPIKKMQSRPFLNFLGQHSLPIYLVHQPVIFGLIWAYSQLS